MLPISLWNCHVLFTRLSVVQITVAGDCAWGEPRNVMLNLRWKL
jgi:hypothetical protein